MEENSQEFTIGNKDDRIDSPDVSLTSTVVPSSFWHDIESSKDADIPIAIDFPSLSSTFNIIDDEFDAMIEDVLRPLNDEPDWAKFSEEEVLYCEIPDHLT
jgi:hypothetical protein